MTIFLWIMAAGFVIGIIFGIIFRLTNKQVLCMVSLAISFVCCMSFVIDIAIDPVKNKENNQENQENTATYIEGVDFSEIYKAYEENELRAKDIYKNNRYRITAKVNKITTDGLFNLTGGATLTMELKVDNTIVFFYAEFEKDQEEELKTINVGDTITFEGKCLSAGTWSDCKIIK